LRAPRLSLFALCLAVVAVGVPPAQAGTAADEPFFPQAGNRGYDVTDYEVDLAYSRSGRVEAKATINARVTETRKSFSFDFRGPRVTRVEVGGGPGGVSFRRNRRKLIVLLDQPIERKGTLWADVFYSGVPPTITDPDGTMEGWVRTDDGALAVGEPQGTPAWLPCNNVPGDKAAFSIDITVPSDLKAISNGGLFGIKERGGRTTYSWGEGRQMSTYLAVVDIGRGRLYKSGVDGRRGWTLVDPRLQERSRPVLASLSEIVRFESGLFGPYPFVGAGSIVDYAPGLGYALETQSRPIYPYVPDLTTVVHETAHQWFGDSVGLKRWPEIWLNEGFATWTEWYYAEQHGRRSAKEIFNRLYRVPASNEQFWNPPSAHPGSAKNLFGPSVYIRGAMALEALRLKVGTEPMLRTLRAWANGHRYGSGTIKEFIALSERISGRNLDPFFGRWLYQRGKP
jgi:aminopeptidase N